MTSNDTRPPETAGPLALAAGLLETMRQEEETLTRLCGHFEQQMAALRNRRKEAIDASTDETNEKVNSLGHLRQARERQTRLLGRVLRVERERVTFDDLAGAFRTTDGGQEIASSILEKRDTIRSLALTAQQRCRDLEFVLHQAVELGHDLLQAAQGIESTAAPQAYTASGTAAQSKSSRSFLNRMG